MLLRSTNTPAEACALRALPPIDLEVPAGLQTATFASG